MSTHFTNKVRLTDLTARMMFGIMLVKEVFDDEGVDLWFTSVDDSAHGRGSKHPDGDAIDIRTKHLQGGYVGAQAQRIYEKLKKRLAPLFDVVLEHNHIHIEYDPR